MSPLSQKKIKGQVVLYEDGSMHISRNGKVDINGLSTEKQLKLIDAMWCFAINCLEPTRDSVAGPLRKVTEGELAILPQIIDRLLG